DTGAMIVVEISITDGTLAAAKRSRPEDAGLRRAQSAGAHIGAVNAEGAGREAGLAQRYRNRVRLLARRTWAAEDADWSGSWTLPPRPHSLHDVLEGSVVAKEPCFRDDGVVDERFPGCSPRVRRSEKQLEIRVSGIFQTPPRDRLQKRVPDAIGVES